nr:copia protein [Tanacetum cinerariifolium]
MKQALIDYDIRLDDVLIMCDNKVAIDLNKNPVKHSRTEHIEIRHDFLRDNVQKGNISIEKVSSEDNITKIFTKPLKRESFNYLRHDLGMMENIIQYGVNYNLEGQTLVEFVIQNQFFSLTLKEFGQILGIPFEFHCSFSDKWSLDDIEFSVSTSDPYQTNYPSPMTSNFTFKLNGRILSLTWIDIICENVFCLGGNRDHIPACLCHMLYCIATSTKYNLSYFVVKRMEFVTKQARLILPYGMLLTHLFDHVMSENPKLSNDQYVLYDHVMYPLTAQQDRKTQKDYGTKRGRSSTFASSSFAFGQPSYSYHNDDDDDGNDEGTSRASTPSPTSFVNSLLIAR